MQAFKIIVTDPDSVLNALTREVQEIGPDGQEVVDHPQLCACQVSLLSDCLLSCILVCLLGNESGTGCV